MSNSKRGYEITVPLKNGTSKLIRYGANELALIEDKTGIKSVIVLLQDKQRLMDSLGIKALTIFVWAGIKGARGDEGPDWDVEQVGNLIDLTKLGDYYAAIGKAIRLALTGTLEEPQKKEAALGEEDPTRSSAAPAAGGAGTT